ncbi:MAG: mechanosensitive ion channel [Methyloprofundus sp.]|nr:mechanosensitive ion channel [Methyloprofundus sp.]
MRESVMTLKHCVFDMTLILILLLPSYHLQAEMVSGSVINFAISRDGLQSRMEKLTAKQGIDKGSKAKEMRWYQLADTNIADQQWFEFLSSTYQLVLKTAPEKLIKTHARYKDDSFFVNKQLAEKESELFIITLKDELRKISDKITQLESELNQYIDRPRKIREEMQSAEKGLKQAKIEINEERSATENRYEHEAHKVYLHTLINTLLAELKKLELEAASNPVQIQFSRYSQESLAIQQNNLLEVIAEQEKLLQAQQLETQKKLQEELLLSERESISKHPVIQKIIQNNIQWSRDIQTTVHSINYYEDEIDKIESYKKEVEDDYKSAEKKIRLAGLSPILGRVLREQRRNLARNKQQYQYNDSINDETGLISLAQYQIELRQKQLRNRQGELEQYLQLVLLGPGSAELSNANIEQIRQELQALLNSQKQVLDQLMSTYLKGLRVLGDYEFARQQLLTQVNQYEAYLDERLLWVPSSPVIDFKYPLDVYDSLHWAILPGRWVQLGQDLLNIAKEKIFVSSFCAIFLIFLFYIKPYIREKSCAIKEKVGKPYTDNIYYTFQVLLFNFILILPVAFFLFYISLLLSSLPFQNDFSRAIGVGLYYAAVVLLILRFFSRFLEDQGIAELHFRWQKKTVCLLNKQLSWMQFLIVPCTFIMYMTSVTHESEHSDSLGRLGFIIFIVVLFIFTVRLLQPNKGILTPYFVKNKDLWWVKLRYVWFIVCTSIPLIILGFSIMGYYVSALELEQKIIITIRMIFIAVIVHNIIIRWLGLAYRDLALKNARNQHKAQELNAQSSELSSSDTLVVDEALLNIPKINEQTKKIVNVFINALLLLSFWVIWKNILPAFSFIDNIVLWQHIVVVEGQESLQGVTLFNLFLAGLYIFLVGIAVINFPGVMEVLVFRSLDIEAGSRYAVNQLAKYSLVTLGFILVANELGGSWSQVQWLVAALTVGLGFGLQEIFANMVSGIIILFERPIRVGDTVTVGNITGRVARIQMRATTITDWDHKELIVPNKSIITNQLINWTLTDPVTRIVISLGISYDADVELAHKIISETLDSTPLVLKEPEPSVFFIGFGDSSLDFSIRVYVSEFSNRFPVTHDIHVGLLQALRKQGIEIPFPQRDLHVRSVSDHYSIKGI